MEAVTTDHLRKAESGAMFPALETEGEIAVPGQWREDERVVDVEGADGKHGGREFRIQEAESRSRKLAAEGIPGF